MKQFNPGDVVPGCDGRFIFDFEQKLYAAGPEQDARDHGPSGVPPRVANQARKKPRPAA